MPAVVLRDDLDVDKTILLEWILKRKEGIRLTQNTDKRRVLVKTVITIRSP